MEDIRIKLSVLWIARMLTGFLGDVIRFFEPGIIQGIIDGNIDGMLMTHEMLFFMALTFRHLGLQHFGNRLLGYSKWIFLSILNGSRSIAGPKAIPAGICSTKNDLFVGKDQNPLSAPEVFVIVFSENHFMAHCF